MEKKLTLKTKGDKDVSESKMSLEDIIADNENRFRQAVKTYKDLAYVNCKEHLLEENLSKPLINRVSREFAIGTDLMRALLKEELLKMDDADTTSKEKIADKIETADPEVTASQAEKAAEQVKEIAQETDSSLDVIYIEGDIEKALNRSLAAAMRSHNLWKNKGKIDKNNYLNICIIGDVGVGKTERVNAWCRFNKIRPVYFKADSLTIDDIKDIPTGEDPDRPGRAKTVSFGTFDKLNKDDLCVLYLDEYNRAAPEKRDFWFKLMDEHKVYDPTDKETGMMFLPNLLFTVVTINPYHLDTTTGEVDDEEGVNALTKAESNRFAKKLELSSQGENFNKYQADYYKKYFKQSTREQPEYAEENAGRLAIALKLLENPRFFFNDTKKIIEYHKKGLPFLTPRSLTLLLASCDGTVKDFLEEAQWTVGTENRNMMATLLKDYHDIDDTPNAVWNFWNNYGVKLEKKTDEQEPKEEEQGVLKTRSTLLNKLKDARNKNL